MKKLISFTFITSLVILFTSCGTDGILDKGFAPENIYGLTFEWSGYKLYNFDHSNSFEVEYDDDLGPSFEYFLTSTPTYSYSKTSPNTASLTMEYSDKMVGFNKYEVPNDLYFEFELTFTSETEGVLSGLYKSSVSNVSKNINDDEFELY